MTITNHPITKVWTLCLTLSLSTLKACMFLIYFSKKPTACSSIPTACPYFQTLFVPGILHMQLPHQLQWLVPWANPKQRIWTKLKANHSPLWDPLQNQTTTGSNPEKQFDNSHEKYTLRQPTLETKHNSALSNSPWISHHGLFPN